MKMKFGVLAGTVIAVMMGLSGQAVAGSDEEQLARRFVGAGGAGQCELRHDLSAR